MNGADQRETLSAEVTQALGEVTAIAATLGVRATEVAGTAVSASTSVAMLDGVNQQLSVTMRAAIPPTDQVVYNSGPVTPGLNAPLPGEWTPTPPPGTTSVPGAGAATPPADSPNQLTAVGPALSVRESDGCAVALQSAFPASTSRIYATTRILNARSGTSIQATWSTNGQVAFSNTPYTIPSDDPDFCVWFYIEPADVTFAPGEWSLQFLVNGQPSGMSASFSLTA